MLEQRLIRRCMNCGHVISADEAKEKTCIACGALVREVPNTIIKGAGSPASAISGGGT